METHLNLVEFARDYAMFHHVGQKYDGLPYIVGHLDVVVRNLQETGVTDPIILAVAYLHDIIEDTSVTHTQLSKDFGIVIANHVLNLTDGQGENRFSRQINTYSRLRSDKISLIVKLADRLTNMNASEGIEKYSKTYVSEYERFKGSLYDHSLESREYRRGDNLLVDHQRDLWAKLDEINQKLRMGLGIGVL